MSLRFIQDRIRRVEGILGHYESLRDEITDQILEAYGYKHHYTENMDFTEEGVSIRFYHIDGWHEKEYDSILIPFSVIDSQDPILAATEHAKELKAAKDKREAELIAARELQELERLQKKFSGIEIPKEKP